MAKSLKPSIMIRSETDINGFCNIFKEIFPATFFRIQLIVYNIYIYATSKKGGNGIELKKPRGSILTYTSDCSTWNDKLPTNSVFDSPLWSLGVEGVLGCMEINKLTADYNYYNGRTTNSTVKETHCFFLSLLGGCFWWCLCHFHISILLPRKFDTD